MKNPKPKNIPNPNWNTATDAPCGKEPLNQDRLRKLEEARRKNKEN